MKKYRFFYHYRKIDNRMSIHFKKQCIPCDNIICNVPCQTKRNKVQPYLVLQGFATNVKFENNIAIIE